MDLHLLSYYIGITIVIASHLKLASSMPMHAKLNLLAAAMVAYYFTHKEGFINF